MKASLESAVAAIGLILLFSRTLSAQLAAHFSVDAAVAHTSVTGGEYIERGKGVFAGGVYVDLGFQRTPVQLVLGTTGERYHNGDLVNAICIRGSHGQCLSRPPDLGGLLGVIGLRYEPLPVIRTLVAFGYGDVGGLNDTGQAQTNARAEELRAEVCVRVIHHVAVGARFQYITVPDYTGLRLTARPVSVVFSLQ